MSMQILIVEQTAMIILKAVVNFYAFKLYIIILNKYLNLCTFQNDFDLSIVMTVDYRCFSRFHSERGVSEFRCETMFGGLSKV